MLKDEILRKKLALNFVLVEANIKKFLNHKSLAIVIAFLLLLELAWDDFNDETPFKYAVSVLESKMTTMQTKKHDPNWQNLLRRGSKFVAKHRLHREDLSWSGLNFSEDSTISGTLAAISENGTRELEPEISRELCLMFLRSHLGDCSILPELMAACCCCDIKEDASLVLEKACSVLEKATILDSKIKAVDLSSHILKYCQGNGEIRVSFCLCICLKCFYY